MGHMATLVYVKGPTGERAFPNTYPDPMLRIAVLTLLPLVAACHSSHQDHAKALSVEVVGRCLMKKVYHDGVDVTRQHNPSDNRWFEFSADGTFISDGDPHGRNTGTWTLEEASQELHIDSDAGEDDDSYWIVSLKSDTMRWNGARFDWNKRFALLHVRQ